MMEALAGAGFGSGNREGVCEVPEPAAEGIDAGTHLAAVRSAPDHEDADPAAARGGGFPGCTLGR